MMGALSPSLKRRLWGARAAALLCLSLSLAAAINPAEADKVGVAAAVNPDAFSSLAGTPQTQLNIGKSIFFNERINTTGSGLVQVLLVDGSTFTVGPGSDLVIDKFVYDPKKGTGEIAASFSKGVMRFVGGKISKNDDAVTLKTPAGALAIRGCIVLGKMQSSSNFGFVLVYGDYMKMNQRTVFMPGYGFFSQNGKVEVGPATKEIIDGMMAGLTNSTGGTGNGEAAKPPTIHAFQPALSETADEIINEATTTQIVDAFNEQKNNTCTGAGCNPQPTPDTCTGAGCNPQPTPDNTRILTRAFSYPGFGTSPNKSPSDRGILGGDQTQTADDFTSLGTPNADNTRVTGTFAVHNTTNDTSEDVTGTFDFPSFPTRRLQRIRCLRRRQQQCCRY